MRLELHWYRVDAMVAAPTTRLVGGRLEIDLEELTRHLESDARLTRVRLDLAHPGESCRIARIFVGGDATDLDSRSHRASGPRSGSIGVKRGRFQRSG